MARVERATRAGLISVLAACAMCLAAIVPSPSLGASRSKPPYTTQHSGYRKHARFVVTYTGRGKWGTVYHSEPPNQGGDHDTNDAHDASTQRWSLLFGQSVAVSPC